MPDRNISEAARRRRQAAVAGHRQDEPAARGLAADLDPDVRATALGALARMDRLRAEDLLAGLADPEPTVRRRACELTAGGTGSAELGAALVRALGDREATVAEVAAWALGELRPCPDGAVTALSAMVANHDDALCREAAVAALGAIGDPAGLPAVLVATKDKPAVRRRAVLALAPFEGPEVDDALAAATADRDWQVRQAAEDLGHPRS